MIRKLMASTAVLALMSTGAFTIAQAQTEPANPPVVEEQAQTTAPATAAEPTTELAASEEALTPDVPTFATAFIGRSVYSSEDPESENIGDVNDLIISDDGSITHAIVGVGGFLGIGEKDVAVPFDELQVVEKDGDIRLIYASTREQLEAAPAIDRTAFDPAARAAEEQAAQTDSGTLAPAPAEPAQDLAAAPVEEPAAPAETETAAATTVEATPAVPAQDLAAAPVEEPAAPAETETAAAPVEEPAAPAAAETTAATIEEAAPAEPSQEMAAAPAEEPAADATAPAEQDVAAAPADATTAPAEDLTAAPAEEQVAAAPEAESATAPASGDVSFVAASADQIHATDLMGKSVYGAENESIGEISDLIFEEEGKTRVALIDVGGFLGAGEKTVGIPFDQLQISKAEDGSEQVKVAMSKADLEQLPAIEVDTAAAAPDAMAPAEPVAGEQPADDMAAAPAEPAVTTEQPVDAAQAPAADEITTGSIAPAADYALATQDIAASKLIGSVVYGPDDANLGEVSDLIFTKTGDIDAAIVDVGGFLGMGEKPVALQFGALNVRTDENGAMTVMVNATQEQLEQAPTFEELEQAAAQ